MFQTTDYACSDGCKEALMVERMDKFQQSEYARTRSIFKETEKYLGLGKMFPHIDVKVKRK